LHIDRRHFLPGLGDKRERRLVSELATWRYSPVDDDKRGNRGGGQAVRPDAGEQALLNEVPMRGAGVTMPPTDPLIYRFYELVLVNGPAWKALIEEEFGDGIMSAIDFDMVMERLPDPKGDRVKITMSGKFLPFKYYGATGNAQAYGYKEE
jgi:cyanase